MTKNQQVNFKAAPIRKAIFPVGGLGTRFLPATKAMPKEMLPVVDKPLIQYAVEEAWAAGIKECIFVTGRGKQAMEDHFDHSYELRDTLERRGKRAVWEKISTHVPRPGGMVYVRQQEALGLGHAVWCARHLIGDEPFAVLLADDLIQTAKKTDAPCLAQMVQAYEAAGGGNLIAVSEVAKDQTDKYGILSPISEEGDLIKANGLVEKPAPNIAPSNWAVIGRYILQPAIFEHLDKQEKGAGGEIQLTDSIARMIGHMPFHGYKFQGRRFDCGDKMGFLEANIAYALDHEDLPDAAERIQQCLDERKSTLESTVTAIKVTKGDNGKIKTEVKEVA